MKFVSGDEFTRYYFIPLAISIMATCIIGCVHSKRDGENKPFLDSLKLLKKKAEHISMTSKIAHEDVASSSNAIDKNQ